MRLSFRPLIEPENLGVASKTEYLCKQGRRNVYGHSGLFRTKFWKNDIRNMTGDDKFCIEILISPDKVLKSGQS